MMNHDLNDESNVEEKANLGKSRKKTKISVFCELMIMHASFKHFLMYVRKMWILLNP